MKGIDKEILKKVTPSQPTADYLMREFFNYLDYCEENEEVISKHSWRAFLNVTDQIYGSWMTATRNITDVTEEQFIERREVLKKIDKQIERKLSQDLLTSDRTNGNLIFYLKNSYKWTDRPQEDDKAIQIKSRGFLSKKAKK